MSPCRCRKGPGLAVTTTTTTKGPAVTVNGGVRFALNTGNKVQEFPTELEARAARVRQGTGRVYRI